MTELGQERADTAQAPNFRFGRFSNLGVTGPRVRSWLQAEVRARLIDVRSCTDNGHCCGEVRFRSD